MLIDFGHKFKDLDGKEVKNTDEECTSMMDVCVSVLTGAVGKPKNPSGVDSIRRYKLAVRIHDAKAPIDLSAEEIAMLKKMVGENYIPLIAAPALEILDPPAEEAKPKTKDK